ncbi:hypothetical protein Bca4012_037210 [Brassica carinata]
MMLFNDKVKIDALREKKKSSSSNPSPPRVKKVKPRKKDGGFSVVTSGHKTKVCRCGGDSGCGGGCSEDIIQM